MHATVAAEGRSARMAAAFIQGASPEGSSPVSRSVSETLSVRTSALELRVQRGKEEVRVRVRVRVS